MATPEHKLTGKTDEPAEQSASPGAEEQPTSRGGAERTGSAAESVQPEGLGASVERGAHAAESGQAQGGSYKVHIPMYEGPLDLLLDLIRQQKMSIHDIQISLI